MEEEKKPNFNSIKHRSIESATNTDLLINISKLTEMGKIVTFGGTIITIVAISLILIKSSSKYLYILLSLGLTSFIVGIILLLIVKYKFEFSFQSEKIILKIGGLIFTSTKEYFISKLDYIIIDQMHVENDDEGKEEIPSKIIINSIDEGYDEIFSGSGKPPLFTNEEVQFFNQFMKININKKQ